MSENEPSIERQMYAHDIYEDAADWHVNLGDEKIHPKSASGKWRSVKWLTESLWLAIFVGPYLRWGERQAILFDIPDRQFHIFGITILPQDVWMLSLTLLFFALLLAAVTSIAGRVYCGFFCFQTAWTDVFIWVEERIEGMPAKRRKLDSGRWNGDKIRKKASKWGIWLLISLLTGISFVAWFTDAFQLWNDLFTGNAGATSVFVIALFTAGTLLLAGKMREQTCFWLCPYARIQGVMYDKETLLPTYDIQRGEPRGRLKKGRQIEGNGDCIECNQCVAVCPTGIDIRQGQQEGCITCALCIDVCDNVMHRISKPKGLIRYTSLDEIEGNPSILMIKRPRVLIYLTIITLALGGIIYGLTHMGAIELKVLHERSPLFVQLSNGSIQNKYDLKILNKTDKDVYAMASARGLDNMTIKGMEEPLLTKKGHTSSFIVFVNAPPASLTDERMPLIFEVVNTDNPEQLSEYESMFFSPR